MLQQFKENAEINDVKTLPHVGVITTDHSKSHEFNKNQYKNKAQPPNFKLNITINVTIIWTRQLS